MVNAVEKCKKTASTVHYSSQAEQALKNECMKQSITYNKIISPVATRWNSEVMCLESCLQVKEAIIALAGNNESFHDKAPSPREWDMIEGGVIVLKKFKEMSELWSSDKAPTLHEVIPSLYNINGEHGHLDNFISGKYSKGKGRMFASHLKASLDNRFPKCGCCCSEEVFAIANFLDPRFHGLHLSVYKMESLFEQTKDKVVKMVEDVLAMEATLSSSVDSTDESEDTVGPTASQLLLKRTSMKRNLEKCMTLSPGKGEVRIYLGMKKLCPDSDGDQILAWWKSHAGTLPGLAKLARKYLGIPASSAISERVFSTGGNVVSQTRTMLDTENVSAIVCLHNNMKML